MVEPKQNPVTPMVVGADDRTPAAPLDVPHPFRPLWRDPESCGVARPDGSTCLFVADADIHRTSAAEGTQPAAEWAFVAHLPRGKYRIEETTKGWAVLAIDGQAGGWGRPSADGTTPTAEPAAAGRFADRTSPVHDLPVHQPATSSGDTEAAAAEREARKLRALCTCGGPWGTAHLADCAIRLLPSSSGQTAEHGIDTAAVRARTAEDRKLRGFDQAANYQVLCDRVERLCDALDRQREETARLREMSRFGIAAEYMRQRDDARALLRSQTDNVIATERLADGLAQQRDDARDLAAALEAELAEIETTAREIRAEAQEFEALTDAADAAMSARVLVCNKVLAILRPAGAGDGEAGR